MPTAGTGGVSGSTGRGVSEGGADRWARRPWRKPDAAMGALAGANYYQFRLDSTGNNACDTGWFPAAGATSVALSGLASGTYYWGGPCLLRRNVPRSQRRHLVEFHGRNVVSAAGSVRKGDAGRRRHGPGDERHAWLGRQFGATSDQYRLDATNNAACDGAWQPASSGVTVGGLPAGTTFYWQVRARNSSTMTLADGDTWWSFTTASGGPTAPTIVAGIWHRRSGRGADAAVDGRRGRRLHRVLGYDRQQQLRQRVVAERRRGDPLPGGAGGGNLLLAGAGAHIRRGRGDRQRHLVELHGRGWGTAAWSLRQGHAGRRRHGPGDKRHAWLGRQFGGDQLRGTAWTPQTTARATARGRRPRRARR